MSDRKRHGWTRGLAFFAIGFAWSFLVGCHLDGGVNPPDKVPDDPGPDFQLMEEAWNTIHRVYADRSALKPQKLTYGAISGMVNALGDTGHSAFLTPEMVKQERDVTTGRLEGIGAELRVKDNHMVVVAPFDGSPAQRAGIRAGDMILKIDDRDIGSLSLEEVVRRIKGPAGSSVRLTIFSPKTGKTSEVTIVRARIVLHNVTWATLPGTRLAHVRLANFSQGVTADLKKELRSAQSDGVTGIILDLRNNPGGVLGEAVATASQFLSSGNVLLEKDAEGKVDPVPVEPGGVAHTVPLVVLINGGTASASEIVAGALQDARRALLLGEKTFGTGTVLEPFPLRDGSTLLLAVKEWLTPDGHVIWHHGVTPDVAVALGPEAAPLVPAVEKGMSPTQLEASGDNQLLQAMELLMKEPRRTARSEQMRTARGGLGVDHLPGETGCRPGRLLKNAHLPANGVCERGVQGVRLHPPQ